MTPLSWRASFAYLFRHPWQLSLSIIGIAIGVAVIIAVDLANESSRKAFLLSMDTVTGAATHQIIGGPRGVDEQVYVDLRVQEGIDRITPVVEGTVNINGASLQVLGVDLFAEQGMRDFTAGGPGEDSTAPFRDFLLTSGAAIISGETAAGLGLKPGDDFTLSAAGKQHSGKLVALFGDSESATLDRIITVDIASAQHWLGQYGWLSRIDVRIEDDAALARLRSVLPEGIQVLSAAGRTQATADLSAAFMTNLQAMSLLALLVGLFLIYNSVSFSVLQRRKLIGTLRALGVTRRQVLLLVMGESAILGLFAAVIGVFLGILLGEQLLALVSRSINDLYFRVSVSDVSVVALTISKGVLAGIGAALVAAAVPAIEATSYAPRLSMTRSNLETRTRSLLPWIALIGVATMLLALLVLIASGRSLIAGLAAVFMLILGFALCVPLVVRVVTLGLAPLVGRVGRVTARLAVSGIAASLSRTGVAIVALAVAVAATIGVSVMVDSFRGSVSSWLSQTLQADVYTGVQRGDFDKALLEDIVALPGVDSYSTSRRATIEEADGRTQILAIAMAPDAYAGTQLIDAKADEVWPRWEREDALLVSEPYSYQNRVAPGDSVTLRTDKREVDFSVLGVYQSYDVNGSAVLMSRTIYDRHFDDDGIDSIGLYLDETVTADAMIDRVSELSEGRQALMLNSNAKIRELSLDIFDQTFVITDVLYWLATGVAFIGILSSMLALQLENGREQGLLRALGMTPLQIGGMITLQTGVIGLLSGLAAIPLGVVMAYVLIEVINRRAFGWGIDMAVAPDILLTAVAFAMLSSLLAGLYPAWRAGRAEPALVMREE